MANNSWVKLYRSLLAWEWYHDIVTRDLFIHCLLKVNYKKTTWKGVEIEEGSFITSYENLANELNFSVRNIRTALKHLKATNEITTQTTNKYTVINVVNWGLYQVKEFTSDMQDSNQGDNQPTCNRHATDMQVTTVKEVKTIKKEKNVINKEVIPMTDFENIASYWNELVKDTNISKVRVKFSETRKKHVKARIKETDLKTFYEMMNKVIKSDFLCGNKSLDWIANFSWCINPENYMKILEGNYENKKGTNKNGKSQTLEQEIEQRAKEVEKYLGVKEE